MKPKLIPNWRRAWRMFSVQAQLTAGALLTTWATLGDLQERIPVWLVITVAVTILVLGTLGRLIDQPKTREDRK